jgi:hypothetical protein
VEARGRTVVLIILYVVFIAAFGFTSVLVGYAVEHLWGKLASLMVFIGINTFALWGAWVIAVKLTEPKANKEPGLESSAVHLPRQEVP